MVRGGFVAMGRMVGPVRKPPNVIRNALEDEMEWIVVLLVAILVVLFGILGAIKNGFNQVIVGLEALDRNTTEPSAPHSG